ncbi:MAG: acylneuraminate cytidylyltransferase family protein [Elusimicrobiota bacterium]
MNIIAIIPARGGSKGIRNKNLSLLGGYPLVAYAIAAARLSRRIRRTIVSTDSREIAETARRFGAEVPFMRPRRFARDDSPDLEWVRHALDWLRREEGGMPDLLVHLRPTTPLREPRIIDAAIARLAARPEATSMRSAHPVAETPVKWFRLRGGGYFKGLLPGYTIEQLNLPRQAFPTVYVPDGYVDVLRPSYISRTGRLHGPQMLGFISPVCHEVDAPEDLDFLRYVVGDGKHVLTHHLRRSHPL